MSKRALVSVSDKTGIVDFVRGLVEQDYEIISTGGTARKLREGGIEVLDVSEVTGFPEMMDGRVKSLHPVIHGGLLALRDNEDHMQQLEEQSITPIDMVVVNLYPFAETVSQQGVSLKEAQENIDIGGPSMIRSAAKNFQDVAVVTEPDEYEEILQLMKNNDGQLPTAKKKELAVKAFARTAAYDRMIFTYLNQQLEEEKGESEQSAQLPDKFNLHFEKKLDLRYGENPHQQAAFYQDKTVTEPSVTLAEQLHGKELSFNNINDTNGALELIKEFNEPAAAVIKHTNPCGLATAENIFAAYKKAHAGDPLSAFGSIVALNRRVDEKTAAEIADPDKYVEVVIAPDYDQEAVEILQERWDNVRLLKTGPLHRQSQQDKFELKKVTGGLLVQERNDLLYRDEELEIVTDKKPDKEQLENLLFAWTAVKHVKSNAIVMARDRALVGVGAGQMSRVDAMIIAGRKAEDRSAGAVVASDAFFPFRDAIDRAAKEGITAIIQPGGSIRDEEVIAAANEHGIPMVLTGNRHFKH